MTADGGEAHVQVLPNAAPSPKARPGWRGWRASCNGYCHFSGPESRARAVDVSLPAGGSSGRQISARNGSARRCCDVSSQTLIAADQNLCNRQAGRKPFTKLSSARHQRNHACRCSLAPRPERIGAGRRSCRRRSQLLHKSLQEKSS